MKNCPSQMTMLALSAMALAFGMPTAARAEPGIKFSGFGTVGVAKSTERNADFVSSLAQPKGAGASKDWSATPDSRIGFQLDAKLNDEWSAAAQVLSRYQWDNSYSPKLSMAFARWAPGSGVELRAGRLPYPAFLVSDYREVGYAQTLVRPPLEVYSLSVDALDGADATWRTSVGEAGVKLQAVVGQGEKKITQGTIKVNQVIGANATVDLGSLSARISYVNVGKASLASPQLDSVFAMVRSGLPAGALGPGTPALPPDPVTADKYQLVNKHAGYASLGLSYDPGDWFMAGELAHLSAAGFNEATDEAYVTVGVRMGAFTPYTSMARVKHKKLSTGNPIAQQVVDSFNATDRTSASLGLRWDWAKSADLKVQVDRVSNATGSNGFLINPTSSFVPGGKFTVLSLAIDFVF